MGLLAGLSVLSIIEIFYHIMIECLQSHDKVEPLYQINQFIQEDQGNQNHSLCKLSRYYFKFIKSSHMHGIHYTRDQTQSRCGRIFWTFLMAVSMSVCSVFVIDMHEHSKKSPMAMSIDSQVWTLDDVSSVWSFRAWILPKLFQIPFPSVVICPHVDKEKYSSDKRCYFDGVCEEDEPDEA